MHNQVMLTKQDLKHIEEIIDNRLEIKLEEKLEEKLTEKLKYIPTTDLFLTKMAEVMGELKDIREEQTMLGYRVSTHSDDITALQDIHPKNKHNTAN